MWEEYAPCALAKDSAHSLDALALQLAKTPPSRRTSIDAMRAAARERLRQCEGIERPAPGESGRYLAQAALAGHVPSIVQFASGSFVQGRPLDNLQTLALYKTEARRLAERAAASGSGEAAVMLALAHAGTPWSGLLNQVVEVDPVESAAIFELIGEQLPAGTDDLRQLSRVLAQAEQGLTPAQRERVRQRLTELRAGWKPLTRTLPRESTDRPGTGATTDADAGCDLESYLD